MKTPRATAFSLLEVIMVMAIIALVTVFVIPAASNTMMGMRVTGASNQVLGIIANARQKAIVRNRTVEVRFYRFADPEMPGEDPAKPESGRYRALQVFEYDDHGAALPVTQVERLPDGIIFDANTALSSIFDPKQSKSFVPPLDPPVVIPRGTGTKYQCSAFQFTPTGSTRFGFGKWFVTLHKATDGDNLAVPPPNYATIQVEAISGTAKIHRP